jgi:hypothetical protein
MRVGIRESLHVTLYQWLNKMGVLLCSWAALAYTVFWVVMVAAVGGPGGLTTVAANRGAQKFMRQLRGQLQLFYSAGRCGFVAHFFRSPPAVTG